MSHDGHRYNSKSNLGHYPIEVLPVSPVEAPNRKSLTIMLLCDFVPATTVGVLLLLQIAFASPVWRGFYCDDESIRYPYREETIPSWSLYSLGALLNFALAIVLEYRQFVRMDLIDWSRLRGLNFRTNRANKQLESAAASTAPQFGRSVEMKLLMSIYCRLMLYLLGLLASTSITEISKYGVGRLRPNFFSVCQPMIGNMASGQYVNGEYFCSQTQHKYLYITDYYCAANKRVDARLSFMSGHSSYAAYCATFASVYLQSMLADTPVFRATIQLTLLLMAYYTGLTRVTDHRHHWSDVLAGLAQGTLMALLTCRYVWPAYRRKWASYLVATQAEQTSLLHVVPVADHSTDQSSEGLSPSHERPTSGERYRPSTRLEEPVRLSYDEFVV